MATPNAIEFMNKLSSDKSFYTPIESLWEVTFTKSPTISLPQMYGKVSGVHNGSSAGKHSRYLATTVTIPNERPTIQSFSTGNNNTGGYLDGYGVSKRPAFATEAPVSINFIETEDDITDTYFRMWCIAVGRKGLITDNDFKGEMIVREYNTQGIVRKTFKFSGVFPTAVEGYQLQYSPETTIRQKSVTFGYENYAVL